MELVWKVELKTINKDPNKWVQDIFNIFCLDNQETQSVVPNDSIARSWFLTIFKACYEIRSRNRIRQKIGEIQGNSVFLVDIMPRFSRYEGKKFLMLVFSYDCADTMDIKRIEGLQLELSKFLETKYGNVFDSYFSVKVKIEKYIESVKIQNPAIMVTNAEAASLHLEPPSWKQVEGLHYKKYHSIQYLHKKKEQKREEYIRELKSIYVVDQKPPQDGKDTGERSYFYDRIHTEFLFFIRGAHLEKEFKETYRQVGFLHKLVEFLEDQWVKIRTMFSIMPRFTISNKSVASRVFFYLLEVNAQIYALLTKIKFDMDHKKATYDEAFERLHFTIEQNGTDSEIEYFRQINQIAYKSYESYNHKISILDQSATRLSDNIQQLRADFDSNTNVILQWLMFLLSIVLVVWGAITLIYDKGVNTFQNAISNPVYLVIAGVFGSLALVLILYMVLARLWVNSSSTVIDKKIRYMIQNWLNDSEEDDHTYKQQLIQTYLTDSNDKSTFQNKISWGLQFTSLIIPGVALGKIKIEDAIEMIGEIEKVLRKE